MVIGSTRDSKAGCTTFRPSIADSTEIAGVIIPSQKRSPVEKSRRKEIKVNFFFLFFAKTFINAKGHPSPS